MGLMLFVLVVVLFFFFLPKLIFVLFAKWGPTWLAPLLIAVEAVHWFYRQYYTPLRHARKQNIDDALQIEMLLRWSVLLPWQLARHLQLNYMRHLWAMSIMHLWTGTITSLFFKTIAPLLLVIFGTDGDGNEALLVPNVYVLLPVTYGVSLALGKIVLPSKRWHNMLMKYKGSSGGGGSGSGTNSHNKRHVKHMPSNKNNEHDDGTVGDVDDIDDDETTESTESTESSNGSGGESASVSSSGSPPRTPLKNHHLFRLQASPSRGGGSTRAVGSNDVGGNDVRAMGSLEFKNDDPESEDLASESESESLKCLLPRSSPLLQRTARHRNPGTPRGAHARTGVVSYYQ